MIDHARFPRRSAYSGVSRVNTYIDLRISKCKRESESWTMLGPLLLPVSENAKRQRAEIYNPVAMNTLDALLLHPFVRSFRSGALSTPVDSTIFRVYSRGDEVSAIHQERNVRASLLLADRVRTTLRHVCVCVCIDYTHNVSTLGCMDVLDTRSFSIRASRPVAELQGRVRWSRACTRGIDHGRQHAANVRVMMLARKGWLIIRRSLCSSHCCLVMFEISDQVINLL